MSARPNPTNVTEAIHGGLFSNYVAPSDHTADRRYDYPEPHQQQPTQGSAGRGRRHNSRTR